MPHFPNYRPTSLTALPATHPRPRQYAHRQVSVRAGYADYLQVEFTDLSYYEPAEWSWYGDNTTRRTPARCMFFRSPALTRSASRSAM
ncbi:MAG: hypothetical protein R2788_21990 [Saprospiraceae bacterium]